jgi:hypothetical protein
MRYCRLVHGHHHHGDVAWFPALRAATFPLRDGVAIYGGFAGTETSRSQRDFVRNRSILSGDVERNDLNADGNFINETWADMQCINSAHVVTGIGIGASTRLDGFTITGGDARRPLDGGAIYNENASPLLHNLELRGNQTEILGGAIYNNLFSSPRLTDVIISGNRSALVGGGIANANQSSPILTNVTISGNQADTGLGGGSYTESGAPIFQNVVVSGNRALNGAGGGFGFVFSNPILHNVTVSGNHAAQPGAAIAEQTTFGAPPTLTINNSIIWGNAGPDNRQIVRTMLDVTIAYRASLVQNLALDEANLDGTLGANDPLFVAPAPAAEAPTIAGDYRLQATSRLIDAGDLRLLPPDSLTDRAGDPRLIDGNDDGTADLDLGAFEVQRFGGATISPTVIDVVEGGAAASYSLALNRAPTAEVTVTIIVDPQVTVDRTQLIFTPTNWVIPQPVAVRAIDDQAREGAHSGLIRHSAVGADLGGVPVPLSDVLVQIGDNDEAGLVIAPDALTLPADGAPAAYTVRLNSAPTAAVTVTLAPDRLLRTDALTLVFTPETWDRPQVVIVSADGAGASAAAIVHTAAGADAAYAGLRAELAVTVGVAPPPASPPEPAFRIYVPLVRR